MSHSSTLRLGTRASALAQWQAKWVAAEMARLGIQVELVPITTGGDAQQTGPIGAIGVQGVFTKEIQRALLDGSVDLAVHSLKDLPTEPVEGLSLSAVPEREDVADALVLRKPSESKGRESEGTKETGGSDDSSNPSPLKTLPQRARVGTGSLRRRSQLLYARGDLRVSDIRGNVDTRLRRLDEDGYDAIILAVAGLTRLGLAERISQKLAPEMMLSAVGQGALGIETRADDQRTLDIVSKLDDSKTHLAVLAERALLSDLRGGCMAPIGGWGRFEGGELLLTGTVVGVDGGLRLLVDDSSPIELPFSKSDSTASKTASATQADRNAAEELGRRVARELLAQGAAELIAASREVN